VNRCKRAICVVQTIDGVTHLMSAIQAFRLARGSYPDSDADTERPLLAQTGHSAGPAPHAHQRMHVGVIRAAAWRLVHPDAIRARRPWSGRADQALTGSRLSPSRELGPLPARVYIKGGLIETVSRATSARGPESTVPVPDGVSADSARVLAARESEHQPPRPTRRKRLRRELGAVG